MYAADCGLYRDVWKQKKQLLNDVTAFFVGQPGLEPGTSRL